MSHQLVCLEIGKGDFQQGFPVVLRVWQENQGTPTSITGNLPPVPMVSESYQNWQSSYQERNFNAYRKIDPIEGQVTNISIAESALDLQSSFNDWLNSGNKEFREIRDQLLKICSQNSQKIRLIIQTDEVLLYQLPWHLWDILDDQYELEPSFSLMNVKNRETISQNLTEKVRILVVLGDSTNINVDADLVLLKENFPEAEIEPLIVFHRQQLSDELWEKNWDILFFAGHSDSDLDTDQGRIYLTATESITIQELKDGLENAIQHGLKLAIFNSCLGLGIAKDLASLQMPAIIVMRERIPDLAAQRFLEYFLKAFATNHNSLQNSVRIARKRLKETVDAEHPCASWLPILFENPTQESPTWIGLRKEKEKQKKPLSVWYILALSLGVASIINGLRALGTLQAWELKSFDYLVRSQPAHQKEDSRLVLVTVTESDIQEFQQSTLQDQTVEKLLKKLEQYQPGVLALNMYRDIPQGPNRAAFLKYIQQNQRFVGLCEIGGNKHRPGVPSPEGVAKEQLGFSDLVRDPDGIIRRNLFAMSPGNSPCSVDKSFSFRVAIHYLAQQGIKLEKNADEDFKLGNVVFKTLEKNTGGYHNLDSRGYQIMINYRSGSRVAQEVTLSQVLNNQVNPSLFKDRIVLIGYTAPSLKNYYPTPYSAGFSPPLEMSGLILNAHQISQILSAVLDNKPLIWTLPKWGEMLWTWGWSFVGVMLVLVCQSRWQLTIFGASSVSSLYGICWGIFFTQAGWLPLIPSMITLLSSAGITFVVLRLGFTSSLALASLTGICFILFWQGGWVPLIPAALALVTTGTTVLIFTNFQN
jgi:CHASE2 domain-containing sensor protein